ncbi:hypothetical protein LNP74_17880 [Klebsiella pneumoniae subsp. pneumoniae]|nr:hypothetical protein [Klebsiella pneumoniae subsp. pneumoniae]
MELLEEHRCFDGQQQQLASSLPCPELRHDVQHFLPPERETPPPVLSTGCRG